MSKYQTPLSNSSKPFLHLVSFAYPPVYGSRREQIFAETLVQYGFSVKVYTCDLPWFENPDYQLDPDLESLPHTAEVIRVTPPPWSIAGKFLHKAGLSKCEYSRFTSALSGKLIKELRKAPGLVMASFPPYSNLKVAYRAACRTNNSLLIDFRQDLWEKQSAYFANKKKLLFEKNICKKATFISVSSNLLKNKICRRQQLPQSLFAVRHDGCLPVKYRQQPKAAPNKLEIISLDADAPYFDLESLFRAVEIMLQSKPHLINLFNLTVYGKPLGKLGSQLYRFQNSTLEFGSFITDDTRQRCLADSDLTILPILPDTSESTCPPALYDSLSYGKPVLAAAPRGEIEKIITITSAGEFTPAGKIRSFATCLENIILNRPLLNQYKSKALASYPKLQFTDSAANIARNLAVKFA